MTQTLIEKLEALPRYDQIEGWIHPDDNALERIDDGEYVEYKRVRAIIEQHKRDSGEAVCDNGYIEGTAERLRLICSKLGISAPVSNEEIMFCQFSLFGAIRRKIDAIYAAPQTAIVAELVKALEPIGQRFVSGNDVPVSRATVTAEEWKTVQAVLAKVKGMMG